MSPPAEQQGSPVLSFITLEQFNAIRLVQSVHQSLASLSKVIRGTSLLSAEVQTLASALLNQKVSNFVMNMLISIEKTQGNRISNNFHVLVFLLIKTLKCSSFKDRNSKTKPFFSWKNFQKYLQKLLNVLLSYQAFS